MPVTLAEANNGALTDLQVAVIDEFRKSSALLDLMTFDDVVSPTGGDVLTYSYRRLTTQPTAAFRQLNTEYTPAEVVTALYTVTLAVLGGSFQVDRVIAKIGNPAQVALQMQQKIKATNAKFNDTVVNGDTGVDANAFNGLDKALVGTTTEIGTTAVTDWSDFDSGTRAEQKALDAIDAFMDNLNSTPTFLMGNTKMLARVRAAARRASAYTRDPVDGLSDNQGRPIFRESYGGITFINPGDKPGTSTPVIPIAASRTVGGTTYTNRLSDLYAVSVGLDGFHGVSTVGGQLVDTWLPDYEHAGAVKTGEVELGPIGVALKATKAAGVLRNVLVQ